MRALVYTAPYKVQLQEVPEPLAAENDVIVAVTLSGICGSDVHGFQGQSAIRVPPAIMGHEFTGTVARAGASKLCEGQRVVVQPVLGCGRCRYCLAGRPNICPSRQLIGAHRPGGFAERVAVPASAVYPIPDALGEVAAALVEPLANALHMVERDETGARESVVIVGAGALGILAAAVARQAGYGRVVVSDINAKRLEIAGHLGATDTILASDSDASERVLDVTGGGADLVIEAVGIEATRRMAIAAAAPGATVVLLGNAQRESLLPVNEIVNRELRLEGSYSSTDPEFRRAIEILAGGGIDTSSWTQQMPLESGPQCFERLAAGEETGKILLRL